MQKNRTSSSQTATHSFHFGAVNVGEEETISHLCGRDLPCYFKHATEYRLYGSLDASIRSPLKKNVQAMKQLSFRALSVKYFFFSFLIRAFYTLKMKKINLLWIYSSKSVARPPQVRIERIVLRPRRTQVWPFLRRSFAAVCQQ